MQKNYGMGEGGARYRVKNTPQFYCTEWVDEPFGDASYLQKIDEDDQMIGNIIEEKIDGLHTND